MHSIPRAVMTCLAVLGLGLVACSGGDSGVAPPGPTPVATVTVTPARPSVLVQDVVAVSAVARDRDGGVLTGRRVSWTYSDSSLVEILAGGSLRGLRIGTLQIVATIEGESDTASVGFVPVVTVGRRWPGLFVGDTTLLSATLWDVAGTPLAGPVPAWSTSNPAIAAVSPQGVVSGLQAGTTYVVAAVSGSRDSQLVTVFGRPHPPSGQISFLTETATQDLWLAQLDGSLPVRLSPTGFTVLNYRWSPDGSVIVLEGGPKDGAVTTLGLYTLIPDGSPPLPIPGGGSAPKWSPDGQWIVFHDNSTGDVGIVARDGSNRHTLPTGVGDDVEGVWSPDGHQILYLKQQPLVPPELWIIDVDGTHQRQLPAQTRVLYSDYEWSPDGKYIALGAAGGAWVINADGAGFRPVSPNCTLSTPCTSPGVRSHPYVSPDGRALTYDTYDAEVHVINVDGTDHRSFPVTGPLSDYQPGPQWSPDGRRLLFRSPNPSDSISPTPVSYSTTLPDGQDLLLGRLQMMVMGALAWRP